MSDQEELELATRRIFELLDAMDFDGMVAMLDDDVAAIDEISRGWMYGRPVLESYFEKLSALVSDVRSTVREIRVVSSGDVGVVTYELDQALTVEGEAVEQSAPTTTVFRRTGGEWRMLVFHSVPLPDAG